MEEILQISLLPPALSVVSYCQQTRQAYVLRDTLKLGGFLLFWLQKRAIFLIDSIACLRDTCTNNTRQAYVLRDMLKLAGYSFIGRAL